METIRSTIYRKFFLSVLIYTCFLLFGSYLYLRSTMTETMLNDSAKTINYIVDNINQSYNTQLGLMETLSKQGEFESRDLPKIKETIRFFMKFSTMFATIHLYDEKGNLLHYDKRDEFPNYRPNKNYKERNDQIFVALAGQAIKERKTKFSSTMYTKSGVAYYIYMIPLFSKMNPSKSIGLISGGFFPSVRRFDSLLQGLALGEKNFIVISDLNGHTVASNGIELKQKQNQSKFSEYLSRYKTGKIEENNFKTTQLNERDYYFVSKKVNSFPFIATIGVDSSQLSSQYKLLAKYLFIALIVGLILGQLMSLYTADRISKPFSAIAEGVRQFCVGNFGHIIKCDKKNEIGQLAHLLNELAIRIRKSRYLGNIWSNESEVEEIFNNKGDEE